MKKKTSAKVIRTPKRGLIKKRYLKALEMADSKTTTVTIRVPEELADWLDRYVALSYPKKLAKGGLVIRSLILGYTLLGEPKEVMLSKLLREIEIEPL